VAACFTPRRAAPALPIRAITTTNSATSLRIIAARVIRAVAGSDHLTYLVEGMRGLLIVQQQEVTAMKLSIVAVAAVFALSSPAFAQSSSSGDGLNGSTLGKSMPGANAGVPYPNPATTDRTPTVRSSGWNQHGAATPKHHRHYKTY
jgi:hypothetical protein